VTKRALIRQAGAVAGPLLVVVDAWNVIRSRWPNFREERFLELVRRSAEREGVEVMVVFDGRSPEILEVNERMSVVGTAGGSADDWIAEHAASWAGEGRRLWVVTSDRELRRRVEPYAEKVIGGGSFAGQLEELER
jgi:predicted RNA-binding protein with PIN domain